MKLTTAILLFVTTLFAAEPQFSDVFTPGKDGWPSIRIPSVVVTKSGLVLAFAEARAKNADQASNKIILKRSTDGGTTWGAVQLIHDDGANSLNNPTALVADSGRVFLMYQRIPAHMHEASKETATGFEGENIYRTFLVTSDDDGATWTKPVDVTRGTKHASGATTVASGPGIGIQLTRGPHKGRLVMPFNEGPFWKWQNYAAFSDDGGATWRCGENAPGAFVPDTKMGERSQINEVQMVELSDGSVRLNSRQFAGTRVRKTAVSKDGGMTWSRVEDAPELRDPSCMASIFRLTFADSGAQSRILYSGPDSTKRENGTIRVSYDEGRTWPVQRVLFQKGFGYSVLTRLKDGTLGCLFETDGANRTVFARFTLDWLTEGVSSATNPTGRFETTGKFGWWPARHEEKVALSKKGGVEIAFLGDSITHHWEKAGAAVWEKFYAPRKAANYGFGGDSTQHVLWRLEHGEFNGITPKLVVLMVGTNNARHGDFTPAQIADGIRTVVAKLGEKIPGSKVLLLAIFPRGATADDEMRKKCAEVNALLPAIADGRRVHFLDISSAFLKADGALGKDIMPDLLHPNAKGYELWAAAMEPKLRELLGEK